ncbi:hypothetical protein HDU82_008888 [Entophlyctis luteolus]|nr:hypothetical protein HDU82_008888 [Entophlyctis luteolus]
MLHHVRFDEFGYVPASGADIQDLTKRAFDVEQPIDQAVGNLVLQVVVDSGVGQTRTGVALALLQGAIEDLRDAAAAVAIVSDVAAAVEAKMGNRTANGEQHCKDFLHQMDKDKAAAARPSDQEIVAQFNAMKQELQSIASKLGELEQEKDEHKMVVDTMAPLNGDRKCFRLVNGVLVERTVADVLPALKLNMENIDKIVVQLVNTYKKKEEEFGAFQVNTTLENETSG